MQQHRQEVNLAEFRIYIHTQDNRMIGSYTVYTLGLRGGKAESLASSQDDQAFDKFQSLNSPGISLTNLDVNEQFFYVYEN